MAEAGIIIVPHPFSGIDPEQIRKKAESAIDAIVANLMQRAGV